MPSSVCFKTDSFLYHKSRVPFLVYSGGNDPPTDVDARNGDLFSSGESVWVKTEWGWEAGIAHGNVKARTCYPNFTDRVLDRTDSGDYRWVAGSTFRSRKHRMTGRDTEDIVQQIRIPISMAQDECVGSRPVSRLRVHSHVVKGECLDAFFFFFSLFRCVHRTSLCLLCIVCHLIVFIYLLFYFDEQGRLNAWLKELKNEWVNKFCSKRSSVAQGIHVLDALLSLHYEVPIFSTFDPCPEIFAGGRRPTMKHVASDMLNCPDADPHDVYRGARCESGEATDAGFVATVYSGLCPSEWASSSRLHSIISVPAQPEGMQLCRLRIPDTIKTDTLCEEDENGPVWTSSFCLAGSFTDVRFSDRAARLITNVDCDILWLFWPATPHNLSWWDRHCVQTSVGVKTVDAILEMHGLELLHARGLQAFVLPPYHLHATLALKTSAYASVSLWGPRWWEQSRQGLEWEVERVADHQSRGVSLEHTESTFLAQEKCLKIWRETAGKSCGRLSAVKVCEWVASMEKFMGDMLETVCTLRQQRTG